MLDHEISLNGEPHRKIGELSDQEIVHTLDLIARGEIGNDDDPSAGVEMFRERLLIEIVARSL